MITVNEALERIFSLLAPLPGERVALREAAGRVLARDAVAARSQPPFPSSAMDGYAIRGEEAEPGAMFRVIGESAAGHRFEGSVGPGQAVRIFTGAPVPEGASRVVMQEEVSRRGDVITIEPDLSESDFIRPAGCDFAVGDSLAAPRRLKPADIALLASMNLPEVTVARRPVIALMATGDELVMPGEDPGPDQIIASNNFGLAALLEGAGAEVRMLPIARDERASLEAAFGLAGGADLIVTIGGASVGDHDLVGQVAGDLGLERAFYKVKMRPGKPLIAGRLGETPMIGLPGNPVSSMVCAQVFLLPAVDLMLGLGARPRPRRTAPLGCDLPANGAREHYMRATLGEKGTITPMPRQDSSLLSVLASADALLVRAPDEGPRKAGEQVEYIPL